MNRNRHVRRACHPAAMIRIAAVALLMVSPAVFGREPPIVFEDVTESLGLWEHLANWELAHAGAWGDVTGNGRPDLYLGAYADRPVYGEPDAPIPNMLFVNETRRFSLSPDEGIRFDRERARASMALCVDLDKNGKLDLLVGTYGAGPDTRRFRNRWPDPFENVTPDWPRRLQMRNATAIDLDRDGLLDLVFTLTVRVQGTASDLNRMGIGATVRLYAEGKAGEAAHLIGRADITIGNGYSCGDEALAHFGLGDRAC